MKNLGHAVTHQGRSDEEIRFAKHMLSGSMRKDIEAMIQGDDDAASKDRMTAATGQAAAGAAKSKDATPAGADEKSDADKQPAKGKKKRR